MQASSLLRKRVVHLLPLHLRTLPPTPYPLPNSKAPLRNLSVILLFFMCYWTMKWGYDVCPMCLPFPYVRLAQLTPLA